ncbi:MAG: phosphodiester glycosidase family protein [Pseudomonadota bacterium]
MISVILAVVTALSTPVASESPCDTLTHGEVVYTACALDLEAYQISLHWQDGAGELIGQPTRLKRLLEASGQEVALITNGGMYHTDRRPVGLLVSEGEELRPLVLGDGPGNFQLLPNGVFYVQDGVAGVLDTEAYAEAEIAPDIATQSGPMLVIDGEFHPAFREASDSVYRRSGVGVLEDGQTVWIVISEGPVNLYQFASVFRDVLELDNALYLDGKVSRLDVPADQRREFGLAMGPILAATYASPDDPADD